MVESVANCKLTRSLHLHMGTSSGKAVGENPFSRYFSFLMRIVCLVLACLISANLHLSLCQWSRTTVFLSFASSNNEEIGSRGAMVLPIGQARNQLQIFYPHRKKFRTKRYRIPSDIFLEGRDIATIAPSSWPQTPVLASKQTFVAYIRPPD